MLALRRPLAELVQIGGGALDAAEGIRRDVAAHEELTAVELAHQVELALRPRQGAGALRLRHALEIPERLEGQHLEAKALDHARDLARRAVEGQEIGLEDLDPLEPGRRDGLQLLGEPAAQRHGGDGSLHGHAEHPSYDFVIAGPVLGLDPRMSGDPDC